VLAAWAICWDGRKVLLHLSPGAKESTENCKEFLNDLKCRGLSDPVFVETDGAAAKASYEAPTPAMARQLRDDVVERSGKLHPSAVQCFEDDFEACIAHLQGPPGQRRVIRTTSLLERPFVEERGLVRAAGHLYGERAVLKMMFSALTRAAEGWRGMAVTDFEKHQLEWLAEQRKAAHLEETTPVTKPRSAPQTSNSRKRT
jgi:transposase-like protein